MSNYSAVFGGLEIGSVSIKWVHGKTDRERIVNIYRHEGSPGEKLTEILKAHGNAPATALVVTGQPMLLSEGVAYRAEIECLEKSLGYYQLEPDIMLSLGGETFTVYPMKGGRVKNIIASSKCAAGTGEFLVQQFQRMGYSLDQGIEAYRDGKDVALATRCSVHCKSDATHKLNKGECTPSDIARSLIDSLAEKVCKMIESAKWPARSIAVSGGVAYNRAFLARLAHLLDKSEIIVRDESPYFAAFGAYLFALEPIERSRHRSHQYHHEIVSADPLPPLTDYDHLVDFRVSDDREQPVRPGETYILAIDAGSTTTKAILLNALDRSIGARCYLRTLGNPIVAANHCLNELIRQIDDQPISITQIAVTGSAREIVSVYLDNCLCFNEILAHARAAQEEVAEVDTLFEIGGQDSKYISFLNGVPVDYAMNEGCSAGTGSFLEESISLDMGVTYKEISVRATRSANPIRFGERCAAFINTDLRSALQQGAKPDAVIAGLVYSIAENYVTRIVGTRALGETILFQGGVALNRAVALAMAARVQRKIIVPRCPELMGCVGAALMARDLMSEKKCSEKKYVIQKLAEGSMAVRGNFRCEACRNRCEIQKIEVGGKVHPFGGMCSRYEAIRHGQPRIKTGIDYVEIRNTLMFDEFSPTRVPSPRGSIGLPMALTSYELLPFYARLVAEMGYELVISEHSKAGAAKTMGPICYPCEIAHGAVYELISKNVDYILIPYIIEFAIPPSYRHAFTCPSTGNIPDIIRSAFKEEYSRFITPHIGLAHHLMDTTRQEIVAMGKSLGVKRSDAERAFEKAVAHYAAFCHKRNDIGITITERATSEPCIILAGRPYITCSNSVNVALPRKIISRGYNVASADVLPFAFDNRYSGNVWYFTAQVMNAIAYVKKYPHLNLCLFSSFSCIPDATMYHLIREELAGKVFCYLELDSHTAHAGIETRLGAFLDIVEHRSGKHVPAAA